MLFTYLARIVDGLVLVRRRCGCELCAAVCCGCTVLGFRWDG